jgi:catechol 2,3-dioxygenase-like lactoylglutathione lyase family enzyme
MAVDGGFRVESLDHVEFYVPDQVEAAEWYADRLGFQPLDAFAGWVDGGPLMIAVDGGRANGRRSDTSAWRSAWTGPASARSSGTWPSTRCATPPAAR